MRRILYALLFMGLPVCGQRALSSTEQDKALAEVRDNALNYSRALPDYWCRQVTIRDHNAIPLLWASNYPGVAGKEPPRIKQEDVIEEDLVGRAAIENYSGENYSKMKINGLPAVNPTHDQLHGTVSASTYTWFPERIFGSGASIRWERLERLHGRTMLVFAFAAPELQGLRLWDGSRDIQREVVVPYKGLLYADAESKALARIEVHAAGFPERSGYTGLDLVLDYKRVRWGDRSVIAPDKFEVHWRSKIATDSAARGIHSGTEEERQQAILKAHKAGQFPDLIPEETNTSGEFKDCRPLAGNGEPEAHPKLLKR